MLDNDNQPDHSNSFYSSENRFLPFANNSEHENNLLNWIKHSVAYAFKQSENAHCVFQWLYLFVWF